MGVRLDTRSLEMFGKKFDDLTHEQKKSAHGSFGKEGGDKRKAHYQNIITAKACDERITNFIYQSWNLAMRNIAYKIQEDIKNQYYNEVRRFYKDYPQDGGNLWYDRTYSLFSAFKPIYHHKGNIYYIGAEINGHNIEYTPYHGIDRRQQVDPWYVFDLFYQEGSHGTDIILKNGTVKYLAEFTYPTPKEVMNEWWGNYVATIKSTLNRTINEELNKAMKHNQSLLRR